jgi:hypothetical protein
MGENEFKIIIIIIIRIIIIIMLANTKTPPNSLQTLTVKHFNA